MKHSNPEVHMDQPFKTISEARHLVRHFVRHLSREMNGHLGAVGPPIPAFTGLTNRTEPTAPANKRSYAKIRLMKPFFLLIFIGVLVTAATAQSAAAKVFETEKAFEKMAAEQGVNAAFIEFMAPMGVMFVPEVRNGREFWKSIPASPALLTWNPIWIDVASNGTLAYSIGNSIRRPKGKDDPNAEYGHYISIWTRQSDGQYRALLDTGINHPKPASNPTEWKSPADSGVEKNEGRLSAADSAVPFYASLESNASSAYKKYLADDVILMRSGKEPFIGKKAAMSTINDTDGIIRIPKRKAFVEGPDLAYVYNVYSIVDKAGNEIEGGNFVQVWKLRKGRWLIAADVFVASPKAN